MDVETKAVITTMVIQDFVSTVAKLITLGIERDVLESNIDRVYREADKRIQKPSGKEAAHFGRRGGH